MNPELQRQLWLRISPARLIATPVVIALALTLVGISNDWALDDLADALLFFGMVFSAYIGSSAAADSMLAELQHKTWDWQRLSSLGPWQMAWGKLAGSTLLGFYGSAFCYAGYVMIGHATSPVVHPVLVVLLALLLSLLAQAVCFLASCGALFGRSSPIAGTGPVLAVLLGMFATSVVTGVVRDRSYDLIAWYGLELTPFALATSSTVAFLGWAWLGGYRMLRTQLQFRSMPWAWVSFVLFTALYYAGFVDVPDTTATDIAVARAFLANIIVLAWAYAAVFGSRMDAASVHRVMLLLERYGARRALLETPPWIATLGLCVLTTLVVVLMPKGAGFVEELPVNATSIGLLAIVVRDTALIFWFRLRSTSPVTHVWLFLALLVVHALLPAIFHVAELGVLRAPLSLYPEGGLIPAGVLLVESALAALLVRSQWLGYARAIDMSREAATLARASGD